MPRNPRTVKLPDAAPILARYMPDFKRRRGVLLAQLDNVNTAKLAGTTATGGDKQNIGAAR